MNLSMHCHVFPFDIKVVDTERASKDFQEKFLPRELDIWPRVNHENIIKMYDHFIECGKIFMVNDEDCFRCKSILN